MSENLKEKDPTQWAYQAIRRMIVDNELSPGSKIKQEILAGKLGVSRTPVVKALHKLETQGMVENIPQKGFYVHALTIKELLDLFYVRESLELIAAEDVVKHVTEEKIREMEKPFRKSSAASDQYRKADIRFHSLLMEYCSNDLVKRINDSFQILNRTFMAGLLRKKEETLPEHRAIIKALRRRSRVDVRNAVSTHVIKSRGLIEQTIERLCEMGVDAETLPVKAARLRAYPKTSSGLRPAAKGVCVVALFDRISADTLRKARLAAAHSHSV